MDSAPIARSISVEAGILKTSIPKLSAWPDRRFEHAEIRLTHRNILGAISAGIPKLVLRYSRPFLRDAIDGYFSLKKPSFLSCPAPDWGIILTEPQATRGLAHSVSTRRLPERAKALLAGFGIDIEIGRLADVVVVAEEGRIDLLILWNKNAEGVVIEAKFGHAVTKGQLKKYRQYIDKKYRRGRARNPNADFKFILLTLDPEANIPLKGRQSSNWTIVSWASLLMRLERALSIDDDDDDFRLFRRLLWQRMGGLKQRRN